MGPWLDFDQMKETKFNSLVILLSMYKARIDKTLSNGKLWMLPLIVMIKVIGTFIFFNCPPSQTKGTHLLTKRKGDNKEKKVKSSKFIS